eukprot:CAMPEP_0173179716 /NCGR_PEP_ID=MMETSP1141-20130122/6290_1 /TAXON_ID=483371 /ORGANISM="non described non described, Strain CCMP2298" /LENGTH=48 /DNA_ID= /DNA_START= /DNA_END= /DNA_ORIENTATION=
MPEYDKGSPMAMGEPLSYSGMLKTPTYLASTEKESFRASSAVDNSATK